MFRLQNNTPSVYVNQSRDFQLFCRLYDCINNGVRFDIRTMVNILDPFKANDRVLTLLCTKVGFFPKAQYDSNILRHIIASFPYAIRHKGTKLGIEIAVGTILKAEKDWSSSSLTFKDLETLIEIDNDTHNISIYTTFAISNIQPLEDFLSYIIPVGYTYSFGTVDKRALGNVVTVNDTISTMMNPSISNSQVRGVDRIFVGQSSSADEFQFRTLFEDNIVGSFTSTEVIGSNNYLTENKYASNKQSINNGDIKLNTSRDTIDRSTSSKEED